MILTEDCLKVIQSIHFSKYSKVFPWIKLGHEKATYLDHISLAPWRIAFTELYVNVMPSAFIEGDYKKHQYEIHYCVYWENIDITTCNSTQLCLTENPYDIVLRRVFHAGIFFSEEIYTSIFLIKENQFPPPHPYPPATPWFTVIATKLRIWSLATLAMNYS